MPFSGQSRSQRHSNWITEGVRALQKLKRDEKMTSTPTKKTTTIKAEEKKKKTVFKQLLDSPFNLTWHSVDQQVSTDILDVLCSLLAPLASHLSIQPIPSKKRRRKAGNNNNAQPLFTHPPPPLLSSVTIGFNPNTQHLESEIQDPSNRRMRAVFVARGDTSSSHLYAHFPMMASMLPSIRLVSLAKGAEARFCDTLKLPRVGVIGLMDDTPGAETLFQLVEEKVPRIECPWITDGGNLSFVPTRVKWIETLSNNKSAKKKAKKTSVEEKTKTINVQET